MQAYCSQEEKNTVDLRFHSENKSANSGESKVLKIGEGKQKRRKKFPPFEFLFLNPQARCLSYSIEIFLVCEGCYHNSFDGMHTIFGFVEYDGGF